MIPPGSGDDTRGSGEAIAGSATGSRTTPEFGSIKHPRAIIQGKGPTEGTEFGGWAFREAKGLSLDLD
jgi:hypothetical protein